MSLGHAFLVTAVMAGCLAFSAVGHAQEPSPEPTPAADMPASEEEPDAQKAPEPPLVVPEHPTDLGPLLVPPGPVRWVIRARAQEGWESNPLFEQEVGSVAAAEDGDFVTHGSLDIARRFTRPRSDTSLALGGSGTLFARNTAFNQAGAGASMTWNWRPRRRFGTRAGAGYSYGTRQQTVQAEEGLLLPHITSQIFDGNAGLDLGLGRRTKGALDVAYRRVTFDSPTMNDGGQLTASASLDHRTGAESTLTGDYVYARGSSRSELFPPRSSHVASLGWSGPLLPRLRAEGSLGAIYLPAWAEADAAVLPAGGAALVLYWGRARIEAGYRRESGEAFGYGFFRVADLFRIAWQQGLGRRLTWLNGVSYGASHNPEHTYELETASASSTLSLILGRRWVLAGGYTYRRRDYRSEVELPRASSHTLSVSVTREWQAR